jgi:putative oxidoreductase
MFRIIISACEALFDKSKDIGLLFARLLVAYGFLDPALNKWNNIEGVAGWFESIGIPFPVLNTYMAATTEMLGVVLLALGLFTRYISVPLIVVMIVAIVTVHLPHGFAAGDNGFEIPLYYIGFLLLFIGNGAGKISIDNFIFKKESI